VLAKKEGLKGRRGGGYDRASRDSEKSIEYVKYEMSEKI
jgi:hypothetical protein